MVKFDAVVVVYNHIKLVSLSFKPNPPCLNSIQYKPPINLINP